jgi:Ca2+/Na+ antiporter
MISYFWSMLLVCVFYSVIYWLVAFGHKIGKDQARNHFTRAMNRMDTREPNNLKVMSEALEYYNKSGNN